MLIIRSMFLSIPILLRLLMMLPLIIIGYIFVAIFATILIMILAVVSVPLAIFVVIGLFLGLGIFPVMLGIRISSNSRNIEPKGTYSGMAVQSLIYGISEAIGLALILAIILGISYLIDPSIVKSFLPEAAQSGPQIIKLDSATPDKPVVNQTGILTITVLIMFAAAVLRALLLPPIAGGAIGIDPNGQAHTPFAHTGQYFYSSFIVTILSFVLTTLGWLAVPAIAAFFGQTANLEAMLLNLEQGSYANLGWGAVLIYFYFILLSLWFYAIHAAGALLIHTRLRSAFAHKQSIPHPDELSQSDIRALWKSRM